MAYARIYKTMNSTWVLGIAAILGLALPFSVVYAHEFPTGYRFKWNTDVDITVESRIAQSAQVHSAADDYDDNTDLDVDRCSPNSNCGNVIHYSANYGTSDAQAWADMYSRSVKCTNSEHELNGHCNLTNRKADFAYAIYNTAHSLSGDAYHYVARHEMGHIWGLAHTPCGTKSVMRYNCNSYYGYLTHHDRVDINAKY